MRSRRMVLVAVMLVAPAMTAAAIHNFGHRLYVVGQVLDADGLPVSNAEVEGELSPFQYTEPEGPCRSNPCSTSTDALGNYGQQLFWHAHGLDSSITAEIRVEGESFSTSYDLEHRWTVLNAQLSKTVPHDNKTLDRWERSYTIRGRLWVDGGGVPDSGTGWTEGNVPGCMEEYGAGQRCVSVPVNVTLETSDGRTLTRSTETAAGYGDFSVTVTADEPIAGGTATVAAGGEEWSFDLDMQRRATTRVFDLPTPEGEGFPVVPVVAGVGVVAGGFGLYIGYQRWQEKRELERARERSGRKRSN